MRHGLSLAISAAVVKRLDTTRPGYLKTSSEIAKEAKETRDDLKEKYDEKVAESREKYDEMKLKASEKRDDLKEKYDEKMVEGMDLQIILVLIVLNQMCLKKIKLIKFKLLLIV